MLGLGPREIVIIVLIIVLLFGAKKIPELAKSLGQGIREFKKSTKSPLDEEDDKAEKTEKKE